MLNTGEDFRLDVELQRSSGAQELLQVPADSDARLTMDAEAEVKTNFSFTCIYDGSFDYAYDRIVPFIWQNGTRYKLGEYTIVTPELRDKELKLTCFDLCQWVRRIKIEKRLFFPAGFLYREAISSIIENCGVFRYEIEYTDLVFATDREDWELGENCLSIINQLLAEIGYYSLYATLDGRLVSRRKRPATAANVTKVYNSQDPRNRLIPGGTRFVDVFDHPNVFYYTCENPEMETPITAYAENNSPHNKYSTLFMPRNPIFVTVNNVPDHDTLQALANDARLESMISADEVRFQTGLVLHDPNEIVAVSKDIFEGVLLETGWDMVLRTGGLMEHTGRVAMYE